MRNTEKFNAFYQAVDKLQQIGKPSGIDANEPAEYASISDRLRSDVLRLSNEEIDLGEGMHAVSVSDLWHSYAKHCLDYFIGDNQLNLTHDDLRMIPDIVLNYDSVKVEDT